MKGEISGSPAELKIEFEDGDKYILWWDWKELEFHLKNKVLIIEGEGIPNKPIKSIIVTNCIENESPYTRIFSSF